MPNLDKTRFIIEEHRKLVSKIMRDLILALEQRAEDHDKSKLEEPELSAYAIFLDKIKGVKFDSPEYKRLREEFAEACLLHYEKNRHHAEHFPDGIRGMNLIDLIEMICDWKAASIGYGGDIYTSFAVQKKNLGISDQLASIILNTINIM